MRIHKTIPGVLGSLIASLSVLALLLFMVAGVYVTATTREMKQLERGAKTGANVNLIARGQYIVEGVAACGDCHTPRDENGISDRTRWLKGAPVFFQPAQAVPGWPIVAPRLAGLPPGSDAEIITLLTTGIWQQTNKPLRLPMPRFQMTRSDAEAVVAYLKSLNPGGGR
jgi:mono/diheme cytochrome c family protein